MKMTLSAKYSAAKDTFCIFNYGRKRKTNNFIGAGRNGKTHLTTIKCEVIYIVRK